MMHSRKKALALTVITLLAMTTAYAQQFQVSHLKKAAEKLKLDSAALTTDSFPATKLLTVGTQKVVVRTDEKGVVDHLGVPLFAEEMRQLQPSPIYDYLEFTVLDRLYKVSGNTLMMQDLKFEKGDLNSLAKVMETTDGCSIENVAEKYYRVRWTNGGTPSVVVSFPINYELLANSNRKELEQNFIRDIKTFTVTRPVTEKDYTVKMVPTNDPDMFIVPGDQYIISQINDNKYLRVASVDNGDGETHRLQLLFNRHAPQESLTNLMVEPDMPIDNAMMELEFVLGNYKRDTVTVPLRQWMEFCAKQGCRPYFGFDENKEGTLFGVHIMSNKKSGYDHIVSIRADEGELFAEHPLVHAKVYLFTPSTNVRNLFGTPTMPDRPRIKYSR